MEKNFRKKIGADKGWIFTYNDIICLPGYTDFLPAEVDLSTKLGPFEFKIPFIAAGMDTVCEDQMAVAMSLNGGLGVIHRNCSYEKQLQFVKSVKRARSFIIEDVATVLPRMTVDEVRTKMVDYGISGFVVINDNKERKVIGMVTSRDLPFDPNEKGFVEDIMTKNPICLSNNIKREEALLKLYEIRKEKIPLVDKNGILTGLITKKDLKPNYPDAIKDNRGKLLCALACSPFLPNSTNGLNLMKKIAEYTDIMMTDVAEFFKFNDINAAKNMMETLDAKFVLGNIGTYEAAEHLLTRSDFPEDKFIGIKVGMGSGSICTTTLQTGVGSPTLFATAEVADAIKDYNPKISLIADGGFKSPGDFLKALTVGADMLMSGNLFAGCTESPGYLDNINGRKVKVYRGMGSAEARAVGSYAADRYIPNSKQLSEGVSAYVPFVGPVESVLDQLKDGMTNGLIYSGTKTIKDAYKIKIGRVSSEGQKEASPHDLIR